VAGCTHAHFSAVPFIAPIRDLNLKQLWTERLRISARLIPSCFLKRHKAGCTMKRTMLVLAILLASLLAARAASAAPQSRSHGSSTITGVVLGPDDKPVPNAAVSYQQSSGTAPHVVHTDAHGHFTISKLNADNYDLRASGKGVFSDWQKNLTLRKGATQQLTFHLIYAKQVPKAYVKGASKAQN
jgi:hypothetical protein